MNKLYLVLLLFFSTNISAQIHVNFTIDTKTDRKVISPLIYGTNDNYDFAKSKRLGGNRITNYNWENNASNAGRDWYYESDNYVPWQQGVPEDRYNEPGAALKFFHETSLRQKAYSLVTLPMAKYVTADKAGRVDSSQIAPSSRWDKIIYRKPAPFSLVPDLTDKTVYTDESINFMISNYGKSNTTTGVKGYALDNEPGIWFDSHPRLWGHEHTSVKFLMDRSFELSARIKEMDPTAEVFGPASWGVAEFETLQFAPDWEEMNQGKYPTFLNYYLAKMKEKSAESTVNKRLLDVLDLHWYPQGRYDGANPFGNSTDYLNNAARMEMTRSLWDSTYVENTWIGVDGWKRDQFLPFLPKMKKQINTYYPGTKLAITEYSYMGIGHPSGGIAQADALGIFGKQGLYLATYWGGVDGYIKSGFDVFLNYDGKGGQFGDVSISSETDDITNSSVHASVESDNESRTHVVAMNKNQDHPIVARMKINSDVNFKSARVWAFDGTGPHMRQLKNIRVISNNEFEYTIPALTVCHILLTEEDLSLYPDFETTQIYPAAGYSDGTASFDITVKLTDGDNNITKVTADLRQVGGTDSVALVLADLPTSTYILHYPLPQGSPSGLKDIKLTAYDATGRTTESTINYRVIKKTTSTVIWDGDAITKGKGEIFFDAQDTKAKLMKIEKKTTGGNTGQGNLFMHFIHDASKYNVMTFRLSENNDPVDARDISDYGYLEFYIKSNAPAGSDIEFSIRDASAQLNTSSTVFLKAGGYISSFNPASYTKVKIPIADLTLGSQIKLDQIWQFNFSVNTASTGFDVWVDDIKGLPYSHPYKEPVISNLALSKAAGYADGITQVTVTADINDPDGNLKEVTLDLSELGGTNRLPVTGANGKYAHTFIVPEGLVHGVKKISLSASDSTENAVDKTINYKVEEIARTLVLWDGDTQNTGKHIETNKNTVATIDATGGNFKPKSMNVHMDEMGYGFAAATWDWNEDTQNAQVKDLSDKRFVSFYIRVTPPSDHFDLQFYMKDFKINSTTSLSLKGNGYVSSYTGDYQLVKIPLKDLWTNKDLDPKRMVRFGLLSNQLGATKLDFKVDDVVATGSYVADVTIKAVDASCGNSGKIIVENIAGQTGPFNYYLNGQPNTAGLNSHIFNDLDSGIHTIRITGLNNFVYMEEVTVSRVPCTGKMEVKVRDAACGPNGSIQVSNLPAGLKNIKYYLNNAVQVVNTANPVFRGLKPASYQLKITAEGGYLYQEKLVVRGTASAPLVTGTTKNGNVNITVKGGSGIYTYLWSDGSETQHLMQVPNGNYTVVVTDQATQCKTSFSIAVLVPAMELAFTDASCGANGTITVNSVTGGKGNYTYFINNKINPAGTATFSKLKPGTYTIMVKDTAGFSITKKVTIGGYASAPIVTGMIKGHNINVTVKGGSGIYIYQWSEGSTTQHLWEVPDGTYSLTVTDAASGCTSSFTGVVFNPQATIVTIDAACSANGKIIVQNTNASGIVSYYLNGKANPAGINVAEFSGLKPGTYTIKLHAENGFTWTGKATVGGTGNPPVVTAVAADGEIELVVNGGSGIYSYNWSNGATTRDLMEVPSGNYSVVVKDLASGCEITHRVYLSIGKVYTPTLSLYPNPVTAGNPVQLNYNFLAAAKRTVSLRDLTGRVLWKQGITAAKGTLSITLTTLRQGIYLVVVDGKEPSSKQLIVNE